MKKREFRFRAWIPRAHKMCEVTSLMFSRDYVRYITILGNVPKLYTTYAKTTDRVELGEFELMQFTGFKDINGVEVFAGDLVTEPGLAEQKYWPVVFEYGTFLIDGSPIWDYAKYIEKSKDRYAEPTYSLASLEVVGNIYQHPDLLQ